MANRHPINGSIINLAIPNGTTFWLRWVDINASGADDGTIKLWSIKDQKELQQFDGQSLPVTCVAFSSDGSLLVSSTGDWRNYQQRGALRLWDVASGKKTPPRSTLAMEGSWTAAASFETLRNASVTSPAVHWADAR